MQTGEKLPIRIILAAVLCVALLIAVIALYTMPQPTQGEFIPPEFDAAAIAGEPQVPQELGYSKIYRDGMEFSAWVCGKVTQESGAAVVYFTNPSENNVWMKVRMMDQKGNVLGESGLILPGEYVRTVSLAKELKPGSAVSMKIMTYEPETYFSMGAVTLNTTAE